MKSRLSALVLLAMCFAFPAFAQTQSDPVVFTIDPPQDPKPIISSIVPSHIQAGGNFNLTVHGSNFIETSIVQWTSSAEGSATIPLVTTYDGPTQLTAAVPSNLMQAAGKANVTVLNPASTAGGGGDGGNGGDVIGSGHKVTLTWSKPAPDSCGTPPCSEVIGYNAFRSYSKGGPYEVVASIPNGDVTTAIDNWVWPGETIYYVIASIGANGAQSPYSTETKAVIPQDSKSGKKKTPPKHKPPKDTHHGE